MTVILFPIVGIGAIVIAVLAMMATAFVFNTLLGRRQENPVPRQRRWGFMWLAALPILGFVALLAIFSKNSPQIETHVSEDDVVNSPLESLSEGRFELRRAVHTLSGIVSIDEVALLQADEDDLAVPETPAAPVLPAPVLPAVPEEPSVEDGEAAAAVVSPAVEPHADEKASAAADGKKTPATDASTTQITPEELPKSRSEMGADVGQWIRSLIDGSSENETAPSDAGQAAQSANGEVVVLELSDKAAEKLLGESAHAMLKSMNAELPNRIRKTYALISLTPPVDAGVAPVNPVLAAGGLKAIANSIGSIIARSNEPQSLSIEKFPADPVAVQPQVPTEPPFPNWLRNPDGGRIVVETEFSPIAEETKGPLLAEVNRAWIKHLAEFAGSLDPTVKQQAGFVKLELDAETAESCIVEKFERLTGLNTVVEGQKSMRKVYALVEFPEAIDNVAVKKMRLSAQNDRVASLGILVVALWLAVTSAGCGLRMRSHGSRLIRLSGFAVLGLVAMPLALAACGFTAELSNGKTPRRPWTENAAVVKIHVDQNSRVR